MKNKTKTIPVLLLLLAFFVLLAVSGARPCSAASDSIIVSEFMANPKKVSDTLGEWIELYNTSLEPVSLKGWIIKGQGSPHEIQEEIIIEPEDYLTLCKSSDPDTNGGIVCDYQYGGISLTNSGGMIGIGPNEQNLLELSYSSELVLEGKSAELSRTEDFSERTYSLPSSWHQSFQEMLSGDFGTPGLSNSLPPEEPESPTNEGGVGNEEDFPLLLSEIMPNPEGVDRKDNEFIEIYNPNESPIDVQGWKLINKKGQEYIFEAGLVIEPKEYLAVSRSSFGFPLYNTDGSISLVDKGGISKDTLSFSGSAKSGESLNKDPSGAVFWSSSPTPGKEALRGPESSASEKLFIPIQNLEELEELENLSPVSLEGVAVSPSGIPYKNQFYLQNGGQGILIKTGFNSSYGLGDSLTIKGELHKTKARNYLRVPEKNNVSLRDSKEIEYLDLSKCLEDESCAKLKGSAVKFEGNLFKKTSSSLYLKDEGEQEARVFLPENLRSSFSSAEKESFYRARGVLEETSSGFRILATGSHSLKLVSSPPEPKPGSSSKKVAEKTSSKSSLSTKDGSALLKTYPLNSSRQKITKNFTEDKPQKQSWRQLLEERGRLFFRKFLESIA